MLRLKIKGDLNKLIEKAMYKLINDKSVMDAKQTPRILSYDNILQADSTDFDYDLMKVGFTKVRWPRYLHQYLDKEKLIDWLESLQYMSSKGDSLFRSKDMVRRKRDHKYGSCWTALSFRRNPPTLVLYSRVAEFPTRAVLELTMAHKIAEEIRKVLEINENVHFTWFISSLFLSCLHMVPYLAQRGELEEIKNRDDIVGKFIGHQLDHIAGGRVKYGPTKRMQKRLEQFKAGELKSVPIKDLSLWV